MAELSIGYLGAPSDRRESFARLLLSAGHEVCFLDDSASAGVYRRPNSWGPLRPLVRKVARSRAQLFGTFDQAYLTSIVRTIDAESLNCIVAFWGTLPLGDLVAIKRLRPHVKLILNLLCHPLGITKTVAALQNWHFRQCVSACDGILVSSKAMLEYLKAHVFREKEISALIWPPYLPLSDFPLSRKTPDIEMPNLLFLGRMDKKQVSDDVSKSLMEIMDQGVHVHFHKSPQTKIEHPRCHEFPYMSFAQTEIFATQFDASLILYNLPGCSCGDRFEVTVPDRLVAAVAAGVPIAIPVKGYAACHEYLNEYDAVIPFTSFAELADRLKDRPFIEGLRRRAIETSSAYAGERHLQPVLSFLSALVGGLAGSLIVSC